MVQKRPSSTQWVKIRKKVQFREVALFLNILILAKVKIHVFDIFFFEWSIGSPKKQWLAAEFIKKNVKNQR